MKKETKETIITVAKEGFIRPALASVYEFTDAWSRLFFANRIEDLSKRGGIYMFNRRGYNVIRPLSHNKKFPGVTILESLEEHKPKPVETPSRKIDADKLYDKIMDAQDELDIDSDDFAVVNDAYNRMLDLIYAVLEEDE